MPVIVVTKCQYSTKLLVLFTINVATEAFRLVQILPEKIVILSTKKGHENNMAHCYHFKIRIPHPKEGNKILKFKLLVPFKSRKVYLFYELHIYYYF